MKSFKGLTKLLTVGALSLAVSIPAGAVSAASSTSAGHTVPYRVYYVNQTNFDWNAYLQQYYRTYYPVYSQPVKKPAAAPAAKPVTKAPAASQTTTTASSFAWQVLTLVNKERAKAGLAGLAWNQKLSDMALVKAKDMKNKNYFDHNSPTYGSPFNMMSKFGISYRYAGENIAMGQRSPQEVMTGWMNSPGHKANILNSHYTSIGVAYYNGEWVQEFIG